MTIVIPYFCSGGKFLNCLVKYGIVIAFFILFNFILNLAFMTNKQPCAKSLKCPKDHVFILESQVIWI